MIKSTDDFIPTDLPPITPEVELAMLDAVLSIPPAGASLEEFQRWFCKGFSNLMRVSDTTAPSHKLQ